MAAHFKLDNLICFLDFNGMQIDGRVEDVMDIRNPVDKFKAFGWDAVQVDGSDVLAIQTEVNNALSSHDNRPVMIVLKTTKGKGAKCIEEMENNHCIGFPENLEKEVVAELNLQASELGMEVL